MRLQPAAVELDLMEPICPVGKLLLRLASVGATNPGGPAFIAPRSSFELLSMRLADLSAFALI